MRLAELLGELTETYGYTREELAQHAGVNRSQISRWASGKHRPQYEAISAMLNAVRREHPDDEAARMASEIHSAAGYTAIVSAGPGSGKTFAAVTALHDLHKRGKQFSVEKRDLETPVGEVVAHIVTDLEADTEDMSEEEAEAMTARVLENIKRQTAVFLEQERALRVREQRLGRATRHPRSSEDDAHGAE